MAQKSRKTKRDIYIDSLAEAFSKRYNEKEKVAFREYILDRDKKQIRSKTAQELGINIVEITALAKMLSIPKYSAVEIGNFYSRDEFTRLLKELGNMPKMSIAEELNISTYSLNELKSYLER